MTQLVEGMNIQFDNLCQFLPQDKVVEFAQMNPGELLTATEKAIGDARLATQHDKLIALRKGEKEFVMTSTNTSNTLVNLRNQRSTLERDYQRFQQREKCLAQAAVMEHKLLHIQVG